MYALISVSHKKGVEELARALAEQGVKILSTGGTAEYLRSHGVDVIEVSQFTGFPEIFDGRVKTLHPKIFGGILSRRNNKKDNEEAQKNGIFSIDFVVVNLYQFEETAAQSGVTESEAVEQIDIGGPSLLRAAAKNFEYVTVVTDPADYEKVAAEVEKNGKITPETRKNLAWKVFERTAAYDRSIADYFRSRLGKPELLELHYEKVRSLRYGENPHQKAAFFRNPENHDANVTNAEVRSGKELSFNNIVDANSALELVKEFKNPTVAFIKHNNPCGVASAKTIEEAFQLSYEVDTKSAFGSVVALNQPFTKAIAAWALGQKIFMEVIICPSFDREALQLLKEKPNIRLLQTGPLKLDAEKRDIKKVAGGILVQTANTHTVEEKDLRVVTKAKPTDLQIRAMLFANKVCKHVMSNAVVFAKSRPSEARLSQTTRPKGATTFSGYDVTVAIGAGQMSRVDSVWIAGKKGGEAIKGSVMASDAFFPFPDALEEAVKAGAVAIIQPGGSVRDQEVIEAADQLGIAMVFTGVRLFRH